MEQSLTIFLIFPRRYAYIIRIFRSTSYDPRKKNRPYLRRLLTQLLIFCTYVGETFYIKINASSIEFSSFFFRLGHQLRCRTSSVTSASPPPPSFNFEFPVEGVWFHLNRSLENHLYVLYLLYIYIYIKTSEITSTPAYFCSEPCQDDGISLFFQIYTFSFVGMGINRHSYCCFVRRGFFFSI